jgi:prepilin-type N-terminal cleavage/methylation domain-containing protein
MFELVQKRMAAKHNGEGGFTLVELLVVIVILGILAAIVVFAVGGITNKGQSAACSTDKKAIQTAEESYFAQNSAYVAMSAATPGPLVPNYLHEASTLYSVTTPDGKSYSGTIADSSCGTAGNAW